VLQLIRIPNFAIFLGANFISGIGDSAMWLAAAIWLKELTGSSAAAGLTLFMFGCGSLLAPVGGVLADRFRRRQLLVVVDLVAVVPVLLLTLVHHSGQAWLIYTVMLIMGLIGSIMTAAQTALLPLLVPDNLLGEANGLQQMLAEGVRLFAPVLGAALFTVVGPAAVAETDAVTFLMAAMALLAVKVDERARAEQGFRLVREIGMGMRFLSKTAILRQISVAIGLVVLAFGFMESINFSVVTVGLHHSASFIGVLLTVQSVGGVLGAGTAGMLLRYFTERQLIVAGLALAATTPLLLTLPDLTAVTAGFGIGGIALPWVVVAATTVLQRRVPAEIIGRVSGIFSTILVVPQVVSVGVGAALITLVDYHYLLIVVAVLTLLSAGYLATRGDDERRFAAPESSAIRGLDTGNWTARTAGPEEAGD
jgi:MFS family permease